MIEYYRVRRIITIFTFMPTKKEPKNKKQKNEEKTTSKNEEVVVIEETTIESVPEEEWWEQDKSSIEYVQKVKDMEEKKIYEITQKLSEGDWENWDKKKKTLFRYLWEWYAYMQAFMDDTILLTFQKLQEMADKWEKMKEEDEKFYMKVWKYLWWAVWDAGAWFYEKYAELKQGDNLAEQALENELPKLKMKTKMMTTKMELRGIKKWDLEALRNLKNTPTTIEKIKMKKKLMKRRMQLMWVKKWDLDAIKKLKDL